jgi:hypothetical protein
MKRKIGELRNIPIVEGDKNLCKRGTEIHINDLQSKGSSGGGDSKHRTEYYKTEDINSILILAELNINIIYNVGVGLGNTVTSLILPLLMESIEHIKSNIVSINFPQYISGKEYNNIEEVVNDDSVSTEAVKALKTLVNNPATEEEFLYDFYNK